MTAQTNTLSDELVETVARAIYEASGYEAERVAGPDCMVPGYDEDDEDARDFCRTLARAALDASGIERIQEEARKREWQPIETSPRGMCTEFLVCWRPNRFTVGSGIKIAYWHPNGNLVDAGDDEPWRHEAIPTHWMSLPEPPALSADMGGASADA